MYGDVTNTGVSQTPGNVELVYRNEVELDNHLRAIA